MIITLDDTTTSALSFETMQALCEIASHDEIERFMAILDKFSRGRLAVSESDFVIDIIKRLAARRPDADQYILSREIIGDIAKQLATQRPEAAA